MWKQENRFKVILTRDLVNIIYDIEMIKWQIKLHITHTYEYMMGVAMVLRNDCGPLI